MMRKPDYRQLTEQGLKRVAMRFALGEENYGRDNWKKGIHDLDWCNDAFNHAMEHLILYGQGDTTDDHLAAVGWFIFSFCYLETVAGGNPFTAT